MDLIWLLIAVAAIPAVSQLVRALIATISRLIAAAIVVAMATAFLLAISGHLRFGVSHA